MKKLVRWYVISFVLSSSPVIAQTPPNSPANGTPENGQTASTAPQNQPTKTVQFNDWVLTCRKIAASAQAVQICELVQTVAVNGQKTPFAQFAIGKTKPDQPLQITVVAPNNVSFPSSVRVAVDEKDNAPLELAWVRCMPMGCFANTILKDDIQKKWSELETQGRVIFQSGNGQFVAMPFSFKGLKGALAALAKEK